MVSNLCSFSSCRQWQVPVYSPIIVLIAEKGITGPRFSPLVFKFHPIYIIGGTGGISDNRFLPREPILARTVGRRHHRHLQTCWALVYLIVNPFYWYIIWTGPFRSLRTLLRPASLDRSNRYPLHDQSAWFPISGTSRPGARLCPPPPFSVRRKISVEMQHRVSRLCKTTWNSIQ